MLSSGHYDPHYDRERKPRHSVRRTEPSADLVPLELPPNIAMITSMRQIESELQRVLTLLRNKIRQRGFTQLEVQEVLGWGRSYISQLLTRQKSLRIEQVLLILKVIGVDPREFFGELFGWPEAPYAASKPALAPLESSVSEAQQRSAQGLRAELFGLVGLLIEKQVITGEELRSAIEAACRQTEGFPLPPDLRS